MVEREEEGPRSYLHCVNSQHIPSAPEGNLSICVTVCVCMCLCACEFLYACIFYLNI